MSSSERRYEFQGAGAPIFGIQSAMGVAKCFGAHYPKYRGTVQPMGQ